MKLGRNCMACERLVDTRSKDLTEVLMKKQVFTDTIPCKLMVTEVLEELVAFTFK
jgi:hypothetical protein